MEARDAKRSISRILRENRGLCTVQKNKGLAIGFTWCTSTSSWEVRVECEPMTNKVGVLSSKRGSSTPCKKWITSMWSISNFSSIKQADSGKFKMPRQQRWWKLSVLWTSVWLYQHAFSAPNPLGQPRRRDVRCVWTTCAAPGQYCSHYNVSIALTYCFFDVVHVVVVVASWTP